jgi:hypothetical protein
VSNAETHVCVVLGDFWLIFLGPLADIMLCVTQVRCLDYALLMGADITLNSYGGLYADSYALQSAIQAADDHGQLFVTAAGNNYGEATLFAVCINIFRGFISVPPSFLAWCYRLHLQIWT